MISGSRCQVDETCELWDIMQRRVEIPNPCFRTTCQSHLEGSRNPLKMGPIGCAKMP